MKRLIRFSQWNNWLEYLQSKDPEFWLDALISTYKKNREGDSSKYKTYDSPASPVGTTHNTIILNYYNIMPQEAHTSKDLFNKAAKEYFSAVRPEKIKQIAKLAFPSLAQRITDVTIGAGSIIIDVTNQAPQKQSQPGLFDKIKRHFY